MERVYTPLCLWGYFEVVVGGIAPLLVPVLQLDSELVLASVGEGVQRCVPQPVLSQWTAKAFPVFLPCPVEVQRTILTILDHSPPTTCCLHVTFSLNQNKDFGIIKPRFCWSTDSILNSKRGGLRWRSVWVFYVCGESEIPPAVACASLAGWCRFRSLWSRACKSQHSPEDVTSPRGQLTTTRYIFIKPLYQQHLYLVVTPDVLTCGWVLCDALQEKQQVFFPFSSHSCTLCQPREILSYQWDITLLSGSENRSFVFIYCTERFQIVW